MAQFAHQWTAKLPPPKGTKTRASLMQWGTGTERRREMTGCLEDRPEIFELLLAQ